MDQMQQPPSEEPEGSPKSLEEELEQADLKVQLYRSLARSPAWAELARVLKNESTNRTNEVFNSLGAGDAYDTIQLRDGTVHLVPVDAITRLCRTEFSKGVRAGLLMVIDMPRAQDEFWTQVSREIREKMQMLREGEGN